MGYSNEPQFPVISFIESVLSMIVKISEDIANKEKDPSFALVLQFFFYFLILPVYLACKLLLFLIKEFIKSRNNN